jgi:site-specific recombinase XerD
MNEIISKIKELEQETFLNLGNSKSKNTLRAYRSDFLDFEKFCSQYSFQSIPTDPRIVGLYLTQLSKTSKFSTLKRRLASISVIHKIKGFHLDTKHPIIRENLIGIKRKIGSYQKGKKPLLINNLYKIIDLIEHNKVNKYLLSIRDKSILLIGFAGGFRRSELVSLKKSDLEFVSEGLKITLRKSKNDQFSQGFVKGIPYFKNKKYCPVLAVQDWLSSTDKLNQSLIFPYSDKTVAIIVKKYLSLIGLDSKEYSGHSLRSGFATSTAALGADERSIMAMTGHKSAQMVRRYIKEANLFNNNALSRLDIKQSKYL